MNDVLHPSQAALVAAISNDQPVPVRKVRDLVEQKYGPRPHLATIHRWILRGVGGHVLPSFVVGARRYVRPSDLDKFMAALNGQQAVEPRPAA